MQHVIGSSPQQPETHTGFHPHDIYQMTYSINICVTLTALVLVLVSEFFKQYSALVSGKVRTSTTTNLSEQFQVSVSVFSLSLKSTGQKNILPENIPSPDVLMGMVVSAIQSSVGTQSTEGARFCWNKT